MIPVRKLLIAAMLTTATATLTSPSFAQSKPVTEDTVVERYNIKKSNRRQVAEARRHQGAIRYHDVKNDAKVRILERKDQSQTRYIGERDNRAAKWRSECVNAGRLDCDRHLADTRQRRDTTLDRVQTRRDTTHQRLQSRHGATQTRSQLRHKTLRRNNVQRHNATKARVKQRRNRRK